MGKNIEMGQIRWYLEIIYWKLSDALFKNLRKFLNWLKKIRDEVEVAKITKSYRKGIAEIPEAPSYDDVVVEANCERHNHTGYANTHKVGVKLCPHSNGTLANSLPHCQLKIK